jgi:hypothetical protein
VAGDKLLGPEMFHPQEPSEDPEALAEQVKAGEQYVQRLQARGGFCHRRFHGQFFPAPGSMQGSVSLMPLEHGGPCVGRFGLCQLWDEKRGRCIDRTVAEKRIAAADASHIALMELRKEVLGRRPGEPLGGSAPTEGPEGG